MSELKPCPFCGKIPNAEYIEDVMYVICSNDLCGMSCIASVTLKEWNNRPIEDALQKRIVDLESLLRWRPVSEGLPKELEKDDWYEIKNIVVGKRSYGMCSGKWLHMYFSSTHWRPIPELEGTDE